MSQFDKIPNLDQIQNPRIFKFSKTTKLIKLNYREHQYNIIAQKPIYQFHKNRLESSKTPICLKMPKIPMIMHEKCMKTRNKLEKEGQKGLTGFQGQKPFKKLEGKWQKNGWWSLEPTRRERKEKNYLKRTLKKSKSDLF